MSTTIERAVEATSEVRAQAGELNDVLGVAYDSHQRHGLSQQAIGLYQAWVPTTRSGSVQTRMVEQ